jgi:hypothetical protein
VVAIRHLLPALNRGTGARDYYLNASNSDEWIQTTNRRYKIELWKFSTRELSEATSTNPKIQHPQRLSHVTTSVARCNDKCEQRFIRSLDNQLKRRHKDNKVLAQFSLAKVQLNLVTSTTQKNAQRRGIIAKPKNMISKYFWSSFVAQSFTSIFITYNTWLKKIMWWTADYKHIAFKY